MKKYHFLIALLMLFATTSVSVEASAMCRRDHCSCINLCAQGDTDCIQKNSKDTGVWETHHVGKDSNNEEVVEVCSYTYGTGKFKCETPEPRRFICGKKCSVRALDAEYTQYTQDQFVEKVFASCTRGGEPRIVTKSSSEGAPESGAPGSEGAARRRVHMPQSLRPRLRLSSNKNKNRNRNGNSLFSRAITQSQLPHTSGNNSMTNSDTGPGKVPISFALKNNTGSESMAGSNGTRPPKCLLQVEQGICEAVIPKWYFEINAFKKGHKVGGYPLGTCKEFTWGGCTHYTGDGDGNVAGVGVNRFDTREECQSACENIME